MSGRPGTSGSHSGGSHSGSGHTTTRSSGGHHTGSHTSGNSRPGTGHSNSNYGHDNHNNHHGNDYHHPSGGYGHGGPTPPPPPHGHGHRGHSTTVIYRNGSGSRSGGNGSLIGAIILTIILVAILAVFMGSCSNSGKSENYIVREKLTSVPSYDNDCIVDELGWFESVSNTESKLKDFYEETGVQPYIYLKAYDSSLNSDADKEAFAESYYDDHFSNENVFLYVYFEDAKSNVVGYHAYCAGTQAKSVMDADAVEIFWNFLDSNWTNADLSIDKVFINTFNSTANSIMNITTTSNDILKYFIIGVIIVLVVFIIYKIYKTRSDNKIEKERLDAEILNTPMEDLKKEDDLTNKYL